MMEYWNNGMVGIDDQSEYNMLIKKMAVINIMISINYRNSETFNY